MKEGLEGISLRKLSSFQMLRFDPDCIVFPFNKDKELQFIRPPMLLCEVLTLLFLKFCMSMIKRYLFFSNQKIDICTKLWSSSFETVF